MAPSSIKNSKKAARKSEPKPSVAVPSTEQPSKPSKTLKRKKDETNDAALENALPVSAAKKMKKETVQNSKKSKADEDITVEDKTPVAQKEQTKADSKKKGKSISQLLAPKAGKEESEVKETKSMSKSKEISTVESPPPTSAKAKNNSKKVKPTEEIPTSISRPRKSEKSKASAKPKPSKAASPEPEVDEDEDAESDNGQDSDDGSEGGELLHGFSTDDDDSSDDEDAMDMDNTEFDLGKLPTIAKDDATVKRKLEKAKKQPTEDRGVLFLGRLPHGFYEDQLKAYFSQFGEVTRLRVSRNKKTGASKHYGFIEFDSSAVAQIVADTMDNYLLMGHILRCKVIPKDEVHPELWVGSNRKWRAVPTARVARVQHNKPRTEAEQDRAAKRLLKRQQERKLKLAKAGFNYDFDAVSYKKPTTV